MDLDSDYCSNESESPFQNTSRTPTPPKNKEGETGKPTTTMNVDDKSLTFMIGSGGTKEKVVIQDRKSLSGKSAILDEQIASCPTSSPPDCKVEIADLLIDAKVFRLFLEYLRTDGFKCDEPNIEKYLADLISLSLFYEVRHLLGVFVPLAKQTMTLDNCVDLYVLGISNDIEDLRSAANNYFLRMGNAFVEHPSFTKLDCITLSILIASDDFPVVEITLFRRLKDWVTEQCKRLGYPPDRKEFFGRVAGLLFNHVRYAQMAAKDFRKEVVSSGLLNLKDIESIKLRHRTHQGYWHLLPPSNFVDRPRMAKLQFAVPLYNNVQIGFRKIAGASSTIRESVRIMVSHDIYLTAIGFFGPARGDRCPTGNTPFTAYSIKIHLEGDYSKRHFRLPTQNATVVTQENFSVELSHPIRIQRLEPYKLTVHIDGDVTQFGLYPLPQAMVITKVPITFHFGDGDDSIPINYEGTPCSSPSVMNQNAPKINGKNYYKPEPRMTGVIRCISFVVKE